MNLNDPVQYAKGVGPRRAGLLNSAGIRTAGDLLRYRPFRYEDRTCFRRVGDLVADEEVVVQAEVLATGCYTTPMRHVRIFDMLVGDSSGALQVKFFNQAYLDKVLRKGQQVILFGVAKADQYTGGLTLLNPEFEIVAPGADLSVHTGRIVPIYRRIGDLTTRALRRIIFSLLDGLPQQIEDPLPDSLRSAYSFPDQRNSLRLLHFPECPAGQTSDAFLADLAAGRTDFQRRLVFEEFFLFQLGLQTLRRQRDMAPKKRVFEVTDSVRSALKKVLPFHPTVAQKRVLREIVEDLCSPRIMNRLLQGDVGSGKTIIALQAMVLVMENGAQSALMAPTEILAGQHYRNILSYLAGTRYEAVLLTSGIKGKQRREILEAVKAGSVGLIVGTHALIQGEVEFKDLALVVIDEQHRFGVLQRYELIGKGERPDTLVMTATPIPRSLALTLYGDLDLSVIDQMPPGRQPVRTLVKPEGERHEVYRLIREELAKGRQAYIVYPLIEQSEKGEMKAAADMARTLQSDDFRDYTVGLLHGRLKAEEKDELMARFKEGQIDLLVATTVVEVGIDVPNASVMVVEHADRFGLSQLHQLRGRVGRGRHRGLCILATGDSSSREAAERLEIMQQSNDGFKIAERDLEIRGPGEFVGTRQSGMPEFLFGNIVRDRDLLEKAKAEAENYLGQRAFTSDQFTAWWKQRYGLYEVG